MTGDLTTEEITKLFTNLGEIENAAIDEAMEGKKQFTNHEREQAVGKGNAMSDGSYPIENEKQLMDAIQSHGRSKDKAACRAHIKKRAKALGRTDLIPDSWKSGDDAVEFKAGGADRNRGNAETLRRYWTTGPGGAKINWRSPGDWTRCVALLTEHLGPRAKGYCMLRHREMTGLYTGDRRHKSDVIDLSTLGVKATIEVNEPLAQRIRSLLSYDSPSAIPQDIEKGQGQ